MILMNLRVDISRINRQQKYIRTRTYEYTSNNIVLKLVLVVNSRVAEFSASTTSFESYPGGYLELLTQVPPNLYTCFLPLHYHFTVLESYILLLYY